MPPLPPEEQALLGGGATEKRVRAFTLGRHCAREALRMLAQSGQSERAIAFGAMANREAVIGPAFEADAIPAVLRGAGRAPLWPRGCVGAITHTGEYAAAAAASSAIYLGIGLDLERVGRGTARLAERILRPEEREPPRAESPEEQGQRITTIFSAKESIYKALNPVTGIFLGFQDAAVKLDASPENCGGSFAWTLHKSCAPQLKRGFSGWGAYARRDNLVLTGVWVTLDGLK